MKMSKVIHLINMIKLSEYVCRNFTLNLLKHFIFSTFLNDLFTISDNIFQLLFAKKWFYYFYLTARCSYDEFEYCAIDSWIFYSLNFIILLFFWLLLDVSSTNNTLDESQRKLCCFYSIILKCLSSSLTRIWERVKFN